MPHVTVAVLCKSTRRSGGSTGYQRCDSSDILLLEDNSDERYTAKCWKDWCFQHDVRPLAMTTFLFLSRGYNLKHDSV